MFTINIDGNKVEITLKEITLDGGSSIIAKGINKYFDDEFSILPNNGEKLKKEISEIVPDDGKFYVAIVAVNNGEENQYGKVYTKTLVSTQTTKITGPRAVIFNAKNATSSGIRVRKIESGGQYSQTATPYGRSLMHGTVEYCAKSFY